MNWLHYLAEANLYLAVFYLAYYLLLSRETHYQLNRAYLLFSCVAAFALPVLQVGVLKPKAPAADPAAYVMLADRILEAPLQMQAQGIHLTNQGKDEAQQIAAQPTIKPVTIVVPAIAPAVQPQLSVGDYLWYAYLTGSAILLVTLLVRLFSLFLLTRRTPRVKYGKYTIVQLPGTNIAFSFFHCLFLGNNAPAIDTIIEHELVHIRQKHSADIIFLELLKIVNWFNPFVYLLQNSLKTIHEYIADEHTASSETDTLTYATFLVNTAHGVGGSPITHSFFNYSLLKKRIIMLNQKRSGNSARLKYLVTLPICMLLLCVSTLAFTKNYNWIDLDPAKAVASIIKTISKPTSVKLQPTVTANATTPVETAIAKTDNVPAETEASSKAYSPQITKETATTTPTIDSTLIINADAKGHLPFPAVNFSGYVLLDRHIRQSINYHSAAGEKGGFVEVSFTVDNDSKISDLKLEYSANPKLDALALNAFKTYTGPVNDNVGKRIKMGLYFFTDDYSIFKNNNNFGNDPGNMGELVIPNYSYRPKVTSKGYEYDEKTNFWMRDNSNHSQVIIYEKDGSSKLYLVDHATPADLELLKNKYGYEFPSNSYLGMQSIRPTNAEKEFVTGIYVNSYLNDAYKTTFYQHVYDAMKYPAAANRDLKGSVVLLKFNVGNDGGISNVAVAKSGGADFDKAAIDAVSSYTGTVNDKPGEHTIAMSFSIIATELRPTVSESLKTGVGYVGELAMANFKSPFGPPRIVPGSDKK